MYTSSLSQLTGIKFLMPHFYILKAFSYLPGSNVNVYVSRIVGTLLVFAVSLHSALIIQELPESVRNQDYAKLALGINFISVSISTIQKYYLMKWYAGSFNHLSEWVVEWRRKNQVSHLTSKAVPLANYLLYFSTTAASVSWIAQSLWKRRPLILTSLPASWSYALMCIQLPLIMVMPPLVSFPMSVVASSLGLLCNNVYNISKAFERLKYDSETPLSFKNEIKSIVDDHAVSYRILADAQKIQSSMFGLQICYAITISCAFIFGSVKKGVIEKVIHMILPIALSSLPAFLLNCWIGEEITGQFSAVSKHVYNSNWFEAPARVRKLMLPIVEISKKAVVLLGFKVIPMSLNTFNDAMKQSFSLFTILKVLTDDGVSH